MRPQFTPETRAVQMAAEDMRRLGKMFGESKGSFMQPIHGSATQAKYNAIGSSDIATRLLAEGYPVSFAHRVAQLERKKVSEE